MELYGFENWGQYVIHEAHLSQRFKCDNDGYYHCCLSIPFPEVNMSIDDTYEINKEIAETIAQEMSEALVLVFDASKFLPDFMSIMKKLKVLLAINCEQ
ncbi:hypothetical protein SUGI_0527100 [Cryptomeria japonica]|nr:hypothetical protein SUGI_0527100 [Cryptomeria japonica]